MRSAARFSTASAWVLLLALGVATQAHSATGTITHCGLAANHFGGGAGTVLEHSAINATGETWVGATWFQCNDSNVCPAPPPIENNFASYVGPGVATVSNRVITVTGLNIPPDASYDVSIEYFGAFVSHRTQIDPLCLSEAPGGVSVPALPGWGIALLAVVMLAFGLALAARRAEHLT